MGATIQLHRGLEGAIPVLADGEPGFTTDSHKLFVGMSGTNYQIGGAAVVADGDYGDVVVSSGGTVWVVDANVIDVAKMHASATDVLFGRSSAGAGAGQEIACTAAGRALIDDADATAQRATLGLGTAATVDTGTSGTKVPLLNGANTWSSAQTFANSSGVKIQDTDASNTLGLVGGSNLTANRTLTLTTGDASRTITLSGDTTLSGTNTGDQTVTLTGDVTGSGTGSFAATIAANAVTNADIRDGAACSVIGRSANSSGDPADIAASANGQYLGRTSNALGFGYVPGQCIYNNLIAADESTTSTSYTNLTTLDSASVTLDAQHDLLVLYLAYAYQGTALKSAFSEVFLDGTGQTNSELAQTHPNAGYAIAHYIAFVITAVSAGAHTIAIRHKCDAGTAHWLSRQFLIYSVG